MFALKSTLIQQIFTGSYHGQGPGLADRWLDKEKALAPAQHGGSGADSGLGRANVPEILYSWRQKKQKHFQAMLPFYLVTDRTLH